MTLDGSKKADRDYIIRINTSWGGVNFINESEEDFKKREDCAINNRWSKYDTYLDVDIKAGEYAYLYDYDGMETVLVSKSPIIVRE